MAAAHRSLTSAHVLGRWPRASVAHFHYSLNVETIFAKRKGKKKKKKLSFVFIEAESLVDPPIVVSRQ